MTGKWWPAVTEQFSMPVAHSSVRNTRADCYADGFPPYRIGSWDHVLLGSAYPFDMAATDPVGAIVSAGLGPSDVRGVLEGNATRFLRPLEET